jgi:hypothetical protein
MNSFKPFNRGAQFKPFNPLLYPPPRARGRKEIGGSNLRKRRSEAVERSEAIERLERFERGMREERDAL